MNGELNGQHPPPPPYGGVVIHPASFCDPDCSAQEVPLAAGAATITGSHQSVDRCSATPSRPAYGRGVPQWGDGRGYSGGSSYSIRGGSCGGSVETGLGPLEPLLPSLPPELEEHLRTCRCTCNHMGYGNYRAGQVYQTSTLPLPNGPVNRKNTDGVVFAGAPRISTQSTRGSRSLGGSLKRVCSRGGSFKATCDKGLRSSGGSLSKDRELRSSCSVRETSVSTPVTPASYRRAAANHRSATAAVAVGAVSAPAAGSSGGAGVSGSVGATPRYQVSEYTFEREEPDSPFSDEKESSEGNKRKAWEAYTWRHWCVLAALLLLCGGVVLAVAVPLASRGGALAQGQDILARVHHILSTVPLIDGHNDLAWNIRNFVHNKLEKVDMSQNLSAVEPWGSSHWSHTDLARLRHGRVGAQFWAAYVPCGAQYLNAAHVTLEQIDVIKRMIARYPKHLGYAQSYASLMEVYNSGRIASLLGIEGGHLMGASLSVLRMYYDLGIRYLTLTHTCNTP
ncbi:hypothetical protein SK128_010590, partial [Halocaridina rubra]